jgi:hypothetical protein
MFFSRVVLITPRIVPVGYNEKSMMYKNSLKIGSKMFQTYAKEREEEKQHKTPIDWCM